MDGGPAFHRLSEELLTIIVDCFVSPHDTWADPHELLSLRLIHPKFAYLSRILSRAFREVIFVASPRGVELPIDPYLNNVARYVEQVTFLPDAHSWLLGPNRFREIVITQAIYSFAIENDILGSLARLGGSGHPIEQWDEDPPMTDGEIEAGYKEYRERARHAERLLRTGQVQSAWTKMLTCLPRAKTFKLGVRELPRWSRRASFSKHHQSRQSTFDCKVSHWHFHDAEHEAQACHDAIAPIGDILIRIMASSLNAAHVKPEQLILKNVVTDAFRWTTNSDVEDLVLNKLRVLRWKPSFVADTRSYIEPSMANSDKAAQIADRNSDALEKFVDMCHDSLQVLDMGAGFLNIPLCWPPAAIDEGGFLIDKEPIVFPQVEELRVTGYIRTASLAASLLEMPRLRDLTLSNCSLKDLSNDDMWSDVFEAIRNHPNRMRLCMKDLRTDTEGLLRSFECHTGSVRDPDPHEIFNEQRALELFLAGKIEWNDDLDNMYS